MERIQSIADLYGLKVIYDAAHAFGVKYHNKSLLLHGDLSVLSFHATKTFTTFEGGAIICPDIKMKKRIDDLKNFGFHDEETVVAPGINGKMNEVQAAMGLLQLKHIDQVIERRRDIDKKYRKKLESIHGINCPSLPVNTIYNYSHFPILVEKDYPLSRDELYERFCEHDIFVRRYFYPLISEFPMYRGLASASQDNLPVALDVSRKILCLPIYPNLSDEQLSLVIDVIEKSK